MAQRSRPSWAGALAVLILAGAFAYPALFPSADDGGSAARQLTPEPDTRATANTIAAEAEVEPDTAPALPEHAPWIQYAAACVGCARPADADAAAALDAALDAAPDGWQPWDDSAQDVDFSPVEAADDADACAGNEEEEALVLADGARFPVTVAIAGAQWLARARSAVFVALNGANEGVFVRYDPRAACHARVARVAARALSASADIDLRLPLRLYGNTGRPVPNGAREGGAAVTQGGFFLHVLLDQEVWVWPGVHVGFSWRSGGVTFTTAKLSPRVFALTGLLSKRECTEAIESGRSTMVRSPEKHYAPGFDNYRTSTTGYFPHASDIARRLKTLEHQMSRLPSLAYVEDAQLLRYEPGQWYKKHNDYYHNYHPRRGEPDRRKLAAQQRLGGAALLAQRAGVPLAQEDPAGALEAFAAFARDALDAHTQGTTKKRLPVSVKVMRPADGEDDGGNSFQRALCRAALDDADARKALEAGAHGDGWANWVAENVRRQSTGLVLAMLDERPELLQQALAPAWARAVAARTTGGAGGAAAGSAASSGVLSYHAHLTACAASNRAAAAAQGKGGDDPDAQARLPAPFKFVEPNRHVTLLFYLNDVDGGETVFPQSPNRATFDQHTGAFSARRPVHEGMGECSRGLAVSPIAGGAALFYSKLPTGENDPHSEHGGCPPKKGIKWASNGFMWNVPHRDGYQYFR